MSMATNGRTFPREILPSTWWDAPYPTVEEAMALSHVEPTSTTKMWDYIEGGLYTPARGNRKPNMDQQEGKAEWGRSR